MMGRLAPEVLDIKYVKVLSIQTIYNNTYTRTYAQTHKTSGKNFSKKSPTDLL